MGTIRAHTPDEYVTLINLFTVSPKDQLGLTRVQLGDMYWFGKQQPDAISANFHRSADGVRFFNYAQWRSAASLARVRETPEFKEHFSHYRYFDMTSDAHLYEVVLTTGSRPIMIRWPTEVITALRVISVEPGDQARALEVLRGSLTAAEQPGGLLGAALHRSLDGVRVAIYAQWRDTSAMEAAMRD